MPKISEPSAEGVIDIDVMQEMRTSFLEYSCSVIYAWTLPDARDGLRPVQRRILFQMGQMGLRPDRGHVKSSRVMGDVMGRLHPYGDVAIYNTMVRLAQPFTLRLPMIDEHGDSGSLDDGPATPRYMEVCMAPAAMATTSSLDEDTADIAPNYDNTLEQPEALPAVIPNLLVSGSSGTAIGMATNMPPHNLVEVTAAARCLLANPDADLEEITRLVPGSDLPEDRKIVGLEGIREAYASGRGIFKTRATAHIENVTARKKGIVLTELPYLVGPEKVIEKLKDAISAKRIQGVTGIQDLTDRHHGIRLVVEVKNGFNPEAVLLRLYRHTPLEDSFGINNVAFVGGQPQTLGLIELPRVFFDHRLDVTRHRSRLRLDKTSRELHLVDGLPAAVVNIDEIIALIRSSDDAATARMRLMQIFGLTEPQAEYTLGPRLRRLTKYSVIELEQRRSELLEAIADLEDALNSPERLHDLVSAELDEVARAHGIPRRTVLLESDGVTEAGSSAALPFKVADDSCFVLLSGTGLVARTADSSPPAREGEHGPHDAILACAPATTHGQIGVVTSVGQAVRLDVLDVSVTPDAPSLAAEARLHELVSLVEGGHAVGLIGLSEAATPSVLTTECGKIRRVGASHPGKDSWELIGLEKGDSVIGYGHCADVDQIVLVFFDAHLLRFGGSSMRPQGRAGRGVAGIRLGAEVKVIALGVVPGDDIGGTLVTTVSGGRGALEGTVAGNAKVTPLDRFPAKGHGTGGVRAQRLLRGEGCLQFVAVGQAPLHAIGAGGQPIDLPETDERRGGSGQPLAAPATAIG